MTLISMVSMIRYNTASIRMLYIMVYIYLCMYSYYADGALVIRPSQVCHI